MERIQLYKFGTSSLLKEGDFDRRFIRNLARQLIYVREELGIIPIVVCSGSIASGRRLEPALRSNKTVDKQAAAIIGQPELTGVWMWAFRKNKYGKKVHVGEILLKDEDIRNSRKPILRASESAVVFINGPDATYDPETEEQIISLDNDRLSRHVAGIAGADTLALLTGAEGLLDRNKQVIGEIATLEDIERINFFEKTEDGTGGPHIKLLEARNFLTEPGKIAYIAGARIENIIVRIARGERVGTRVTLPLQGYFKI